MKRGLAFCLLVMAYTGFAQRARLIIPSGHTNPVTAIAYSPDGRHVASAEGGTALKLWNTDTGREITVFQGHTEAINDLVFDGTGTLVVSCANDRTIIVWNIRTGIKRNVLTGHTDAVQAILLSADGTRLISGSIDGTVRFWDLTNGSVIGMMKVGAPVTAVALSKSEDYLLIGTRTGQAFLADAHAGKVLSSFAIGDLVNQVRFSPDDQRLLVADNQGRITVINSSSSQVERVIPVFSYRLRKFALAPTGNRLLAVGRDLKHNVKWVDYLTGEVEAPALQLAGESNRQKFDIGLSAVAQAGPAFLLPDYASGIVQWDPATGTMSKHFVGQARPVVGLSVDATGRFLAIASARNEILVMDLTGRQESFLLGGAQAPIDNLAFHPVLPRLVSASREPAIYIWDAQSWEVLKTLKPDGSLSATPFRFDPAFNEIFKKQSPDGIDRYDVFTSRISTVDIKEVYDFQVTPGGQEIIGRAGASLLFYDLKRGRRTGKTDLPGLVAFDVNRAGNTVALVVGNEIRVLDYATRKVTASFRMPDGMGANQIRYVPGREQVVTWNTTVSKFGSTQDNALRIWDLSERRLLETLSGHIAPISEVAFYKDQFLFSGSADGSVRVWSLQEKEEINAYKASIIPLHDAHWVVTSGLGLFDATPGAMREMHYVQEMEVIQLDQLKQKYYEPHLLSKILGFNEEPVRAALALTDLELYPEVTLLHPNLNNGRLGIELHDQGGGIGQVVILINDKEISQDVRGLESIDRTKALVQLAYDVSQHPYLKEGDINKISVKAYNRKGDLVSRTKSVLVYPDENQQKRPARLFAVLAGVSDYHGHQLDLKFAAKDAADMAAALQVSASKYLGSDNFQAQLLTTDQKDKNFWPTKKNIVAALEKVARQATANDILFLYVAGHGVNHGGETGDFYYLTADARNTVLADPSVRQSVAISSAEFTELIRKIPAVRQVMVIDACHSGRLASDMTKGTTAMSSAQVRALESMKDKTGLYVLAGSAADAYSYETSLYGQGLLTYSLLFGMKGPALRDNEYVDIMRLFQFASEKVPRLAATIGGVQKPELRVPAEQTSFDIGHLPGAERGKIPLSSPKPVFTRSEFQDESNFFDHLDLGPLMDFAVKATEKLEADQFVFVDEREFPGAYTIRGRYREETGGLRASVRLFRDKSMISQFAVQGENAGALAQNILAQVRDQIRAMPSK